MADNCACSRPGASMVISAGMFCRSIGGAGGAALISNFSGLPLLRALPDRWILRSASIDISALTASILFSTRSRRLENMIVPPLTLTCSIVKASVVLLAAGFVAAVPASLSRSRRSGKFTTGRMTTRSVIRGLPAHTLASVTSAWMLAAAKRLLMSRSFGSCSVTSFSVMLSCGHRPILAAAVDGELVAGLALDPRLDLPRQEARRDADHQQQRDDGDHGGNGRADDFQCSHFDIPDRANGSHFGGATRGRKRSGEFIPETGCRSEQPKIFRLICELM